MKFLMMQKNFIDTFCLLRAITPGYRRSRVTPYMHILAYHVPIFIERHSCLKKFTRQGVEQNNDEAKKIMFQKSNKWDAAKDAILTENRQWNLKHYEHVKETYTKQKLEYWESEISNIRQQKRQKSSDIAVQVCKAVAKVGEKSRSCPSAKGARILGRSGGMLSPENVVNWSLEMAFSAI